MQCQPRFSNSLNFSCDDVFDNIKITGGHAWHSVAGVISKHRLKSGACNCALLRSGLRKNCSVDVFREIHSNRTDDTPVISNYGVANRLLLLRNAAINQISSDASSRSAGVVRLTGFCANKSIINKS